MISAEDRAQALGRVFRGIVHESTNTLNTILMNAQLASISPDDAEDGLKRILDHARAGGEFLKQLSAFASTDSFTPGRRASLGDCLEMAKRLGGSAARRSGVEIEFDSGDDLELMLDHIAVAISLVLLLDALCALGVEQLRVATQILEDAAIVAIEMDGQVPTIPEQQRGLAFRLAREVCEAHGGAFATSRESWEMRLSR